jgi:hypothetical protein
MSKAFKLLEEEHDSLVQSTVACTSLPSPSEKIITQTIPKTLSDTHSVTRYLRNITRFYCILGVAYLTTERCLDTTIVFVHFNADIPVSNSGKLLHD